MSSKVTMQQIADHIGVSKFAVSKALSGKSGVSRDTREKIIQAATQLGYFSQKRAKTAVLKAPADTSARTGDKNTVIVLIPNVREQNRHSLYWGRIIDGIAGALEERRLGMMIVTEHITDNFAKLINPDGVLGLVGVGLISNQLLLEIRNLGIPFVLVDHEDALIPSDALFMNNFECERRLTNYLLGNGHRSFQFVGSVRYARSFFDRWLGFRSMLEEQGVAHQQNPALLELDGENRTELTERLEVIVREMKEAGVLPTAFVCANDSLAFCVMTALTKACVRVPDDCSVAGFDNLDEAALSTPALSTIHVNKEALGKRSVDTLLWRIDHPDGPKEKILLSGDFVLRQSTGLAPMSRTEMG